MKHFLTALLLSVAIIIPAPSYAETIDDLVLRGGIYYKKFTDEPFTGELTGIEQGKFKNGKKVGIWKIYHENGQLKFKNTFEDNKLEGASEEYNTNGILISKGSFSNNLKDGEWIEYQREGTYRHGLEVGTWVFYYDSDLKQLAATGAYKSGVKDGLWQEFGINGILKTRGNYIQDIKIGLWTETDPLGVRSSGSYKYGKRNGTWKGKKKGRLELMGEYEMGCKIGYSFEYPGWQGYYKDCVKVGDWNQNAKHQKALFKYSNPDGTLRENILAFFLYFNEIDENKYPIMSKGQCLESWGKIEKVGPWHGYYSDGKLRYKTDDWREGFNNIKFYEKDGSESKVHKFFIDGVIGTEKKKNKGSGPTNIHELFPEFNYSKSCDSH